MGKYKTKEKIVEAFQYHEPNIEDREHYWNKEVPDWARTAFFDGLFYYEGDSFNDVNETLFYITIYGSEGIIIDGDYLIGIKDSLSSEYYIDCIEEEDFLDQYELIKLVEEKEGK